ncbi:MAG: pyruvate, phosphate dikinase [Planctomycetes bacterium]|nr:pyruvate, phosphate dikinase [Planctomycetota bacterium]MCP4771330.1 pyruvate, phosphate dikinase [Planctomycetota bacterium]MCP4860436.1 pyruvate, phosphate dikinase [Planctomycetota bacterium]
MTPKKRAPRATKMVYSFGNIKTEGNASMRTLLGGKGANLAEMTNIGLPVPPGFTITTSTCAAFFKNRRKLPKPMYDQMRKAITRVEKETGKTFGSITDPLLLSVRSGAAVSMPGMMNTILNLGLNEAAVEGLAESTGNPRFAYDAYRRLINMYGDVVMEVPHHRFEAQFDKIKASEGVIEDNEVSLKGLKKLCKVYQTIFKRATGIDFPQDPYLQLKLAIEAVFRSWMIDKAITYRRIEGITNLAGTAVNVQAMVFGNKGADSGTGVAFTRNPATGRNKFYGEFLVNAQGEDVVAGIRTPEPVEKMHLWKAPTHKTIGREIKAKLLKVKDILENHYKDVQDIEFTIERGTFYMLQTRVGKRTSAAAVKIACDLVREGLIDEKTALKRVPANGLTQLMLPSFSNKAKLDHELLTVGLPASPGAATGTLAFSADEAVKRAQGGESVILVRRETSPEDVDGMHHAAGILTSTGGMTSHAAVVARGWGKCCVAGAQEVLIDERAKRINIKGQRFSTGDTISIDGTTGEVFVGRIATQAPKLSGDFRLLMKWADKYRRLAVRTNADTPEDARRARSLGAKGIGLCRTEHMFFEGKRITAMREMILATNASARKSALAKLLPFQRKDFVGILTAMAGYPVTVRLLDPPLHEFLPHGARSQKVLAREIGISTKAIADRVSLLHEMNPMLGHRGCRLSVTYPEILKMQVTAITEAAIQCVSGKRKIKAMPEIMVPLIGTERELEVLRALAVETIEEVKLAKKFKGKLDIPVGTMIEIPRAALIADKVAPHADFFSFGTNDLTQMTFGFSRDDINSFLPDYLSQEILEHDPFQSLDATGVGQLVDMACKKGRKIKPKLHLGICGEHGGDPASIAFFHGVGLDYVSCSPFRVPIARLAAAQAAL